jgi:outer membrane receptor protein involved in Fe transport
MRGMRVTLLMAVIAATAQTALAQTGRIYGTVTDQSKAVLPGVTVTVNNPGTGFNQVTVTDAQGHYEARALPIGRYSVGAELAGFAPVRKADINVGLDAQIQIDLLMSVGALAESITVGGQAPIIDTRSSEVGANISQDQIQNLPVQARQWINLATLLPGTGQDAIRSQYYNNVNIGAGINYYTNGFYVDGVINNWQQQGEPRQDYPQDSIAEFRVDASNAPTQYGWFQGGVLSSVTRSGTNEFHGSGFEYYRNASLNARTVFETVKPDYRRDQVGGSLGGPIAKDRAQFYFAGEYTNEHKFFTVNTRGIYPNLDGGNEAPQWLYMLVGRYDQTLTSKQRLFVRVAGEDNRFSFLTAGGTVAASGGFSFAAPRLSAVGGHTWVLGSGALNEFRVQYAPATYIGWASCQNSLSADVIKSAAFTCVPGLRPTTSGSFTPERLLSVPTIYSRPSVTEGTASNFVGPERRTEFKDDFTKAIGAHELKFGADLNWILWTPDNLGVSQAWTFASDAPYDPAIPSTYPTLFTQRLSPYYNRIPSTEHSAYVQDTWRLGNALTANLGLRYDIQTGVWNENLLSNPQPAIVLPTHTIFAGGLLPQSLFPYYDAGVRGDTDNFGPRLGVSWTPSSGTVVRASYGIYYNRFVANSGGTRAELDPLAYTVIIRNPSYPDPYNGRDPFALAAASKNVIIMGNGNQNPRTQQFSAGFTRQIDAHTSVSVDAVIANGSNQPTMLDANYFATPAAIAGGTRPNSQYGQVTENLTIGTEQYRSLEMRLERRMADRWQMLVSYTLATAKITNTALPPNQFDQGAEFGYAPADRRHRLKASGTVVVIGDVSVSGILSYQSSLPFEVTAGRDLNGDGVATDRVPGITYEQGCRAGNALSLVNTYRASTNLAPVSSIACPSYLDIDLQASKSFDVRAGRLTLMFQVFNLFNRANYGLPVGNALSPLFGQATTVTPARQGEVALRFAF